MAVSRASNVRVIAADNDTIVGPFTIEAIVFKAGTTSPSAQLKMTDTSGTILWESGTTSDNARLQENVCIRINAGETLHADLAGTGTLVYLYLEED